MNRRRRLERRIFVWLATFAVLPALAVLVVALLVGSRSLAWLGTLGPWARVAESGRAVIEAVERAPAPDSAVVVAAERHREELSSSLLQASRWRFLGERLLALAPAAGLGFALVLIALALVLSRRLARQIARPVADLVSWAGRLGRGEALPPPGPDEDDEVIEVRVLRDALRQAGKEIEEGRRRGLELERTRAWGEMARRVAHEMKNPLTPLRLAAYRLERGIAAAKDGQNGTAADLEEALAVIREETDRLDELARSFAQLGRPPAGPPTLVDTAELLRRLLESDVPEHIRCDLRVESSAASLTGHYDALQRAFRNVLRNAVEAVAELNGTGAIDVRIADGANDTIEVSIADNGPGIPAGAEEAIFEPDRTFKAKGTGLGLAIVRQVTAMHGGSVAARSRPAGGAEFTIVLPRAFPRAPAQTARE